MLKNVRAMSKQLAGTDEVRKLMRYDTNSCRVHRGAAPLFVTISPDEKHNMLMLRLVRTRHSDPVNKIDELAGKYGGLKTPEMGSDFVQCGVAIEELVNRLPQYDERRAILARDPLASVDGSRIIMSLLLEYIFGIRVCSACPDCAMWGAGQPCMDLFGSNAKPEGGIFGRVDGVYISIEAQKSSGSLHFHAQVFVQSLHQHTCLQEIYDIMKDNDMFSVAEFCRYAEHTTRQVFADVICSTKKRDQREEAWPEYAESLELVSMPKYISLRASPAETLVGGETATACQVREGQDWLQAYLTEHVQQIQEMKQHHVHPLQADGTRSLLQHCRRVDDPSKCKGDFPRDGWLLSETAVLCPGLLQKFGMPSSGRRDRTGLIQAKGNDGWLNPSAAGLMAAAGNFNTDVQIPSRLLILSNSHCGTLCDEKCGRQAGDSLVNIFDVAARAQAAQAGYACDYQCKRLARGFHEVKEHMKGHHKLRETLHGQKVSYIGKRHVGRILSDAFGKDIVRSQQERTNLNVYASDWDVTSAETIKTAQTVHFPGTDLLERFQNDGKRKPGTGWNRIEVDHRDPQHKATVDSDAAYLYLLRPPASQVWYLSAYEFFMYWTLELIRYPCTPVMAEDAVATPEEYQGELTEEGQRKLRRRQGVQRKVLLQEWITL